MRRLLLVPAVFAIGWLILGAPPVADSLAERLTRHRNLGKAFFENPTTHPQAVEEFKKALDLAPNSARERLNYGLALIAAGKTADGIAEVEKVQKQDPKIPHSWFNLGVQYKKAGDYERSQKQFEGMVKLVADEPVSHYNLGVLNKLAGRIDQAAKSFETASRLDPNLAAPHFQLYNLYRQQGRRDEATSRLQRFQEAKKQQENAAVPEDMEWSFYSEILDVVDDESATRDDDAQRAIKLLARRLAPAGKASGMLAMDAQGDGRPDLLTWSPEGLRVYSAALTPLPSAALAAIKNATAVAAGDFNNDTFTDLCVVTPDGAELYANVKGRFSKKALSVPAGSYRTAVWLDYDHDHDLDLFLLGDTSALLRNHGDQGFTDQTAAFPFAAAKAVSAAAFRLIPDTKGTELMVTYADRVILYRDKLGGKFEAQTVALPAGATIVQTVDADNNSTIDLLVNESGKTALWLNRDGSFTRVATPAAGPAVLADVENRAVADLVDANGVARNEGRGKFAAARAVAGLSEANARATADFNGDGKVDIASLAADGSVSVLINQTLGGQWIRVGLAGVKNLKLAPGSEVEVKAGVRYQKKIYEGMPLLFGIRAHKQVDAVRITWPNGLIQNEAIQLAGVHAYKEAQRLSGSCPQVWTWNGREFVYITDVLGVAPLGASSGDGEYFSVDSLEHILISSDSLRPREGKYEIRLTEELAEVAYIDQVRLYAVDHPAGQPVVLNEKFQSPPYPGLRVYRLNSRLSPVARRDLDGAVEFEFSASARGNLLVLHGWIDWPDASAFLGRAQQGRPFASPKLQARDASGAWRTITKDMGVPAGKPKTIAVEVPAGSTVFRIETDLPVHWEQAWLASAGAREPERTEVSPLSADLRFRGFSRVRIHPERKEPEMFFYPDPQPASLWNPTPGFYTRYGAVAELTARVDDEFVIMGSGDELALEFDATRLPPPAAGMKRDFILAVDGWAKDRDPNTAFSQSVEPLPFHGMRAYPYPVTERFPDTPRHQAWREKYNTRPALRLIRPLTLDRTARMAPAASSE